MITNENALLSLTAGDLMSRDVKTIDVETALPAAALQLARWEVHGAPVVDHEGHCVGVLSVSDITRWAASENDLHAARPRTCPFQEKYREPGGRETVVCRAPVGVCAYQRLQEMPDGSLALTCMEPHGVPVEWQMVELESPHLDTVRDVMTTIVVTAELGTTVPELARLMLSRHVHRLVVLDIERHPVGVIAVDDLLQILAHPELATPGSYQ